MTAAVKRPILRYHGGKWKLAPWIVSHFPAHRVYVEPFGGAASVLLRKPRSYGEVYNDLDGEIVNLFRMARERGDELIEAISLTPFAREEFELSYEATSDPLELARRTMVRCSMGFGSSAMNADYRTGFRGSAQRSGTHPGTDWKTLPGNLQSIVQRLRGVIIEHRPALDVMRYHDHASTLHYVDPPYVESTRSGRSAKDAYRHELTDEDHRELAAALRDLKGMVVLSGYPCDLYAELYPDWTRIECHTFADRAKPRIEAIWLSPNIKSQFLL